ncbi:aquaporin-like protein [Melampsora americana]|nr:aquaporin-like protein [Melampsora americana]
MTGNERIDSVTLSMPKVYDSDGNLEITASVSLSLASELWRKHRFPYLPLYLESYLFVFFALSMQSTHSTLRCSCLEGVASMIIVWFLGVFMMSLSTAKLGIHGSAYLAISVSVAVTLLVHIIGPISGGHISPVITLSTCITGLISPVQALAYVFAQMTGATLGGIFLAMALGPRATDVENYGCYFNPSPSFGLSHAFFFEFMGAFAIISMMYGYGMKADSSTTQGGPKLAPLLNGITLGLFVFASSGFAPESSYLGTIGYPTRCWATSIARMRFSSSDWIYWIPSISASVLHGISYRFLNPFGEARVGKILGHEEISESSPKVVIQIGGPMIVQEPSVLRSDEK